MANDFSNRLRRIELELLALKTHQNTGVIRGETAPTQSTRAPIGGIYTWVSGGNGHLAICVGASGGVYTWQTVI